jgi:hypothetical protein
VEITPPTSPHGRGGVSIPPLRGVAKRSEAGGCFPRTRSKNPPTPFNNVLAQGLKNILGEASIINKKINLFFVYNYSNFSLQKLFGFLKYYFKDGKFRLTTKS